MVTAAEAGGGGAFNRGLPWWRPDVPVWASPSPSIDAQREGVLAVAVMVPLAAFPSPAISRIRSAPLLEGTGTIKLEVTGGGGTPGYRAS